MEHDLSQRHKDKKTLSIAEIEEGIRCAGIDCTVCPISFEGRILLDERTQKGTNCLVNLLKALRGEV